MSERTTEQRQQEAYIHDYEGALTEQIIGGRSAATHGAFFLPYLSAEMSLLDCGCGPGTITLGLAQVVLPGAVTGIDIEESQLEQARENAKKLRMTNVTFDKGNVYELPYPDNHFDAVFSHAMLEHMQNPLAVLKEMYRILKPGGVVGVRSTDLAASLLAPSNATLDKAYATWVQYRQHSGGTPLIGREFRSLLRAAGFAKTIGTASSETWGSPEKTKGVMSVLLDEFTGPKITATATQQGWVDEAQMQNAARALTEWGEHPDAFFAIVWCEGVAWKEESKPQDIEDSP